eukprot:531284-Rhodomonas_salina.2
MFHATGWSLHEPAVVEDDEDVVAPPMVFPPGITMGSEEEGMPDEVETNAIDRAPRTLCTSNAIVGI